MKTFWNVMAWLGVGITGLFILTSLGQILSFLCFSIAIIVISPPLEELINSKLLFLEKGLIKFLVWAVLVITGMIFFEVTATVSNLALCTERPYDTCAAEAAEFIKNDEQKLYLSGEQENLDDGTEFTVTFTDSQAAAEVKNQTVKAQVKKETFFLEIDPRNLPSGNYQLTIANDNVILPADSAKEFAVWDAEVKDMIFCPQLQQGVCPKNRTVFVKNTPKLFLSGNHQGLRNGTEFNVELEYLSEPEATAKTTSQTAKVQVRNNKFNLELQPQELPVGSYRLKLLSDELIKVNEPQEFTVWDTEKEAQARWNSEFSLSSTSLVGVSMCDRTGLPLPPIPPESPDLLPSENNLSKEEEKDAQTVFEDSNFCPSDSRSFPSKAKAIGFRVRLDQNENLSKIKIVWKYQGRLIAKTQVVRLNGAARMLDYTLSSPDGFAKGNYELILALQTQNAKPLYRKFKVN